MKNTTIIAIIVLIILIGTGIYFFTKDSTPTTTTTTTATTTVTTTATTTPIDTTKTVIGTSVEMREIVAYHYGTQGPEKKELLFVGGIHGGYEWNTSLVAFQLMDYLTANPTVIPDNVTVTVIPVLNPDGLNKVVGTSSRFTAADVSKSEATQVEGRFNTNGVDLNRNFDCDWKANGTWQNKTVSGGNMPFSEPESLAFKNYIENNGFDAVVVWYSAAGGVFASNCHDGVLAETKTLTSTFAKASGYKAYDDFNFYEITGDMVNWLAKKEIPAISVLLTDHTNTEWTKNKAGIDALLKYFATK